ncbi:Ankyrin repeat-containing protein [Cynara cardunculus var. scolymus]|uniref:Ankyrin repeat-containing protein n=1 Tax=Cynara cardunculus var. scolymus TaxID=59895 RepID=A0A103XZM0_CYNCS|nr:Ankyrin repeat-containing protein [Cynara cardunculus var. scolymus]
MDTCIPLYEASITGDWKTAKTILQTKRDLVRYSITEQCETALHVAASAQRNTESTEFVQNLVRMMEKEDLVLQNNTGNTALCLAAAAGNVEIAEIMVNINEDLLIIPNRKEMMPLYVAALFRNHDMVKYLYESSRKMNGHVICFKVGTAAKENKAMQLLREIWKAIEEKPKIEIDTILRGPSTVIGEKRTYPSRVLFIAAEMGNTKFVIELIRKYPDLIWKQNDNRQSIFHVAVSHRRASIYNLLYEIGSMKDFITSLKDHEGNNMLHLVGKKIEKNQPQDVPGVAFQLQRELLWFKEVESIIPANIKNQKNMAGQTPHELFTDTHKALVSEAEKWMKGTASQCMVVAALIATMVFAVAFTIPGGYNQHDGLPMFLHEGSFIVFVVLDAISLIPSSTSILMFLSILTSRYSQNDFLEPLPNKLMAGLATLFLSCHYDDCF